jgi:transposase
MGPRIWAGLDVGVETTSICVIDDAGEVLKETVCGTVLKDVHAELRWLRRRRFARIALESGCGLSLARGLRSLGYSVDVFESRQLSRFLRARRNKTDAGDASGIAEAGRVGARLVSKVHLKSLEGQLLHSRLSIRRHLIRQRLKTENLLCRQIELFGGRVRGIKRSQLRPKVEAEIATLFGKASTPLTLEFRYLLDHYDALLAHEQGVDRELHRFSSGHELCRRFMQIPGIGPICALTFYAAVEEPDRFTRSVDIGPYLGLTPTLHQSGLTCRTGRISKMGNSATRSLLVHAAITFMQCSSGESALRRWASEIEQRRGRARARVALARKLATVMLAMWKSGEGYRAERRTVPE